VAKWIKLDERGSLRCAFGIGVGSLGQKAARIHAGGFQSCSVLNRCSVRNHGIMTMVAYLWSPICVSCIVYVCVHLSACLAVGRSACLHKHTIWRTCIHCSAQVCVCVLTCVCLYVPVSMYLSLYVCIYMYVYREGCALICLPAYVFQPRIQHRASLSIFTSRVYYYHKPIHRTFGSLSLGLLHMLS